MPLRLPRRRFPRRSCWPGRRRPAPARWRAFPGDGPRRRGMQFEAMPSQRQLSGEFVLGSSRCRRSSLSARRAGLGRFLPRRGPGGSSDAGHVGAT
eukprot:4470397-Pyramimonas_sp.AAC.1